MSQQDYQNTIKVRVPLEEAFRSITSRVSEWWALSLKGQGEHVGDEFSVTFGKTWVLFRITQMILNKKVEWLVTDCNLEFLDNKKEWKDTRVVWEFEETGGEVAISMTHRGLRPDVECYAVCKQGWDKHTGHSLYKLLTENVGEPV